MKMLRSALIRQYATATTSTVVQVPVQLHGIHGRYATALYTAAVKTKKVEEISADLQRIKSFIETDTNINTFLETPILSKIDKIAGVKQLLGKGKYTPETLNFFTVLAENARLDQTHKILASFEQLISAHHGHVTVTVTSAKELDPKSLKALTASVQKSSLVTKNTKLNIVTKIDPEIIGGFIVEVGGKTVDLSVSAKVNKLNRLISMAI